MRRCRDRRAVGGLQATVDRDSCAHEQYLVVRPRARTILRASHAERLVGLVEHRVGAARRAQVDDALRGRAISAVSAAADVASLG